MKLPGLDVLFWFALPWSLGIGTGTACIVGEGKIGLGVWLIVVGIITPFAYLIIKDMR